MFAVVNFSLFCWSLFNSENSRAANIYFIYKIQQNRNIVRTQICSDVLKTAKPLHRRYFLISNIITVSRVTWRLYQGSFTLIMSTICLLYPCVISQFYQHENQWTLFKIYQDLLLIMKIMLLKWLLWAFVPKLGSKVSS